MKMTSSIATMIRMSRKALMTLVIAATLPTFAFGQDDTLANDPYVILFRTKLEEANSDVSAKEASLALAQLRFEQIRILITKGAASRDEYNQLNASLALAKAEFHSAQQRVLARKAMLDVVILNRLAGREVQQCL